MADTVIRKACDRCHHQKLSCKRTAEESCERCKKIQVKCTWSPSLRYKKNQQQLQQQRQQQSKTHGRGTGTQSTPTERRSPKRRRTGSDPELVSPETVPIVPRPGTQPVTTTTSKSAQAPVAAVTPGSAGLDIRDFDFGLGQLDFFHGQQQQHLDPASLHGGVDPFQGHHQHHHNPQLTPPVFFGHWDRTIPQPQNGYIDVTAAQLAGSSNHHHENGIAPLLPLVQRSRGPVQTSVGPSGASNNTSRRRGRRLIALRSPQENRQERLGSTNPLCDFSTPLHWMARLSEINARLQALASLLPAQYEATNGGVQSHAFPVDEMFQLTRQISEVLDQIFNPAKEEQPSSSAKLDGSDPGSAMFVLSVYVMLLDLYHKVFTLVRSEVFQQASAATFTFWKLPDVTIGSFAVESTPSLQMSLTIQLAEDFLSRLRRTTSTLESTRRDASLSACAASTSGNQSIFSPVVDSSYREIKSSEESLRQELAALRDRIESMLEG